MMERRSGNGRIDVLGRLRLYADGVEVATPTGHQHELLLALLVRPNEVVAAASLIELIWPGVDQKAGQRRLRVTASRLRSRLPSGIVLDAAGGGYRLTAPTSAIDRLEFEALAQRARSGDLDAARRALELWRDEPYLDFASTAQLRREQRRLHDTRSRLEALLTGDNGCNRAGTSRSSRVGHHALDEMRRSRIQAHLPAAGSTRLIALIAPTGYGKTVLLEQWADRQLDDVAWIPVTTAPTSDEEFHQLLASNIQRAAGLTASPPSIDLDWSIGDIVNLLLGIGRPMGIVIDDLHLLSDERLRVAVHDLVRLSPPNVTVAIGSRESLPFPTSRLAAADQTTMLGAHDLAFTADELDHLVRPGVQAATAGAPPRRRRGWLHSVTGGWPEPSIAIAAAVNGDATVDPEEAVRGYVAASDLAKRVLGDLPDPLARLLLRTAHLDPLDPSLCALVTGDDDASDAFDDLTARHQLLRRDRGRYRHRPLVGRLLRSHRGSGASGRATGDASAARWYLDHDRPDEALRHGIAVGDPALVAASLEPAVERAATRADGGALLRGATSIALPPFVSDAASQTAILAAGFLPRPDRGHWAPEHHPRSAEQVVLAIEALDLVRAGRCSEALEAVACGRARLGRGRAGRLSPTIETLLWVTEYESLLLLGHPDVHDHRSSIPRRADTASWPWLTVWAYGQRALHAWTAGDDAFASALLRHARHRVGRLHPSWLLGAHGSATVTGALLGLAPDAPADQTRHAVEEVESLLGLSDRRGRGPIGVIARYALHCAHRHRGDETAAAAALTDADAALADLPGLPLLEAVRTRLVHVAAPDEEGPALLSPRERTVVQHLDSDLTLAQIAEVLHVSVHTLKTHTRSIYRKLGVSSRAEAVARQPSG